MHVMISMLSFPDAPITPIEIILDKYEGSNLE